MILYLLHVAFLIAICLIFYKLLLQKETFYRINRWVLLACMPLSFLLPLIRVPQQWSAGPIHQMAVAKVIPSAPAILPEINNQTNIPVKPKPTVNKPAESKQTINPATQNVVPLKTPSFSEKVGAWLKILNTVLLMHWLFVIYITGVVIFSLNLLAQLVFTLYQAYTRPAIIDGVYRIVELSNDKVPCSFLNNIFINPGKYEWETYNLILLHEKIHARQLHSIDILLSELVIILQWFNPFAWWYRKELENNLEYLTDEAVTVKNDVDASSYQLSLLQVSAPQFSLRIATNYNQSLLKKRILMMNAKRSNFHIMWKYFMLIPVFAGLVCTLNQPSLSKNLTTVSNSRSLIDTAFKGDITGFWYANKEKDVLNMDMKIVINGKDMSYNGFTFPVKDLTELPVNKEGKFVLNRNAGTVLFSGKFEGDQGLGRFKMIFNKSYIEYLDKCGIKNTDADPLIGLLVQNVKESYIKCLLNNGFTEIKTRELSNLVFFKVDENDIKFWGQAGLKDFTARDLLTTKLGKVDSSYLKEIRDAGYPHVTFQELCRLKADSVTGSYIKELILARQASKRTNDTANIKPSIGEITAARYMHIDSTYLREIAVAGYNLTESQLHSFKTFNITPDYIKDLQNLGYAKIPATTLLSLKMQKITPEYIRALQGVGYTHLQLNALTQFKAWDITPVYIESFKAIGYTHIEPTVLVMLKMQKITPDFIKGFNDLGFTSVPINEFIELKNTGVTPEYVAAMKQKGLVSTDLQKYITLKNSFN